MRARYLFAASLALLAACGQSPESEAILENVRSTEQAQLAAILAKDVDGAVGVYEADAVMVAPGSDPAVGAPAIRTQFERLLADPELNLRVVPTSGWVSETGQLAVTAFTGELTRTDAASGKPATVPIENQTMWRNTAGAPWSIVLDVNVVSAETAASANPSPSAGS